METKIIYYWPSGVWVDDEASAQLAIDCLGFGEYQLIELDIEANIDNEIAGLTAQTETV